MARTTPSPLRRLSSGVHQLLLLLLWQIARRMPPPSRAAPGEAVLIIPADADGLTGSRGDEAMLAGACAMVEDRLGRVPMWVACTGAEADASARRAGLQPLRVWGGAWMPFAFRRRLAEARPTRALVMGADMMDGLYSPVTALRMIVAADLLARAGARTDFLGFSLNARPAPVVRLAFRLLDAAVAINLRDPSSWRRFGRATGRSARLVADTAFLMAPAAPQTAAAEAERWVQEQRAAGRCVLAVNFHPMLFRGRDPDAQARSLSAALQATLHALTERHRVSWLLLPHDERSAAGDLAMLADLHGRLADPERAWTFHLQHPPPAAQIKALSGAVDGTITGRMHLAIATLGQGRPVLAFAYQGKFSGLMRHFRLPPWLVLEPDEARDGFELCTRVEHFIEALPMLTERVREQLPTVIALARDTFEDYP